MSSKPRRSSSKSGTDDESKKSQIAFGKNLRRARLKASMTQLALATASGTTESYISQIEGGQINVTLETMERLAAALDMAAGDLLPCSVTMTISTCE